MAQLGDGTRFYLADALTGHLEVLPYLVEAQAATSPPVPYQSGELES